VVCESWGNAWTRVANCCVMAFMTATRKAVVLLLLLCMVRHAPPLQLPASNRAARPPPTAMPSFSADAARNSPPSVTGATLKRYLLAQTLTALRPRMVVKMGTVLEKGMSRSWPVMGGRMAAAAWGVSGLDGGGVFWRVQQASVVAAAGCITKPGTRTAAKQPEARRSFAQTTAHLACQLHKLSFPLAGKPKAARARARRAAAPLRGRIVNVSAPPPAPESAQALLFGHDRSIDVHIHQPGGKGSLQRRDGQQQGWEEEQLVRTAAARAVRRLVATTQAPCPLLRSAGVRRARPWATRASSNLTSARSELQLPDNESHSF
jgi:hypothetical protein